MKQYTDQGKTYTLGGAYLLLLFILLLFVPGCFRKAPGTPDYYAEIKYAVNSSDSLYRRVFYSYPTVYRECNPRIGSNYLGSGKAHYCPNIICRGDFELELTSVFLSDTSFFESGKEYPISPKPESTVYCKVGNAERHFIINDGWFSLTLWPSSGILYTFSFDLNLEDFVTGEPYRIKGSADFTNALSPYFDKYNKPKDIIVIRLGLIV